ncbi:MAG: leucyl/phenylalanyl-tRNA--protein transferase [Synechococcales bacterium]|nr:leucyl/phenylalanyl-tRNA--protein transferase [Synechococcales bacterium]
MWDIAEIINGYAQGYFLMADDDDRLRWYRSIERTLMPLDDRFRYPTSLRRVLNQNRFQFRMNSAFQEVVEGCADRETTWISDDLKELYWQLHKAGWAHSFETWQGDRLAGGILGIVVRGIFIGESMFFNIPEGSKVALVKLVEHLRDRDFALFDVQLMNPHLERFGAYIISADEYDDVLQAALDRPCRFL